MTYASAKVKIHFSVHLCSRTWVKCIPEAEFGPSFTHVGVSMICHKVFPSGLYIYDALI